MIAPNPNKKPMPAASQEAFDRMRKLAKIHKMDPDADVIYNVRRKSEMRQPPLRFTPFTGLGSQQ